MATDGWAQAHRGCRVSRRARSTGTANVEGYYVAAFDFNGESESELTLRAGDTIAVGHAAPPLRRPPRARAPLRAAPRSGGRCARSCAQCVSGERCLAGCARAG
jgi:hypothetical protein